MSVDTLRETFHINRVTPDKIQDFLTAQTYRPEITKAKEKIKSLPWVFLQSVCKRPIRQGKSPSYADDAGLLCIKPKNTNEMIVSLEELSYIQPASKDEVAGQRLQKGDIVITRSGSGTIGRASIFLSDKEVYTNDHLFIVRTDTADSHCTCAFLNTYWGHRLLEAGISGSTGQLNLSNEHIKGITLYTPAELAQKYIGDKVRQAERLRAWAKDLRSSVDKVLDQLSLPTAEVPAIVNRVSTERLEARLDPRPYRTHYINLVDRIKAIKHSCVSDVADLASGCPVSSNDFIEGGEVPLVRIRNIGFDEFIDLDTGVTKELHKDEAKYQAKENMIVLGMDGIFRAQFFLSDELPMLVNQRVGMLTANDISAELLTHWLNRAEGQMQLNQWAVKTTVEHTSLSDIGRVRIPRLETDVEDSLADRLLSARRAYRYSRFLTICAKQLVESLIEGQLIEAELIAAEQALQAGNDQLDRRILNRLKTDGVDGQGPALFSDLDELYRLLAQAEGD